ARSPNGLKRLEGIKTARSGNEPYHDSILTTWIFTEGNRLKRALYCDSQWIYSMDRDQRMEDIRTLNTAFHRIPET
ncbi:hypothetical protein M1N54_03600, partial [Thermodesulfovibrionales bacterium]|nr:hypothetical protein [Thermodesulfovibrionales bacterium]